MPKRQSEFFVVDILVAINKIRRKISDISFEEFVANENTVDAAMRNLEVIGEATNQLLKVPSFLEKTNVEWRKIVNFRNVLAHFYFGIDFSMVFNDIIKIKIYELEKEILGLMKSKNDLQVFLQAIQDAKEDLRKMHRNESIDYLSEIEKQLK
jgi:uncharacterized protein with HEPN domain